MFKCNSNFEYADGLLYQNYYSAIQNDDPVVTNNRSISINRVLKTLHLERNPQELDNVLFTILKCTRTNAEFPRKNPRRRPEELIQKYETMKTFLVNHYNEPSEIRTWSRFTLLDYFGSLRIKTRKNKTK